jgi:hypothetical protein
MLRESMLRRAASALRRLFPNATWTGLHSKPEIWLGISICFFFVSFVYFVDDSYLTPGAPSPASPTS